MTLSLPDSASTYFEISNGSDIAQVVRCFTQDAVVTDEGQAYRGHDAIQSWQREAQQKFEYTVEPVSACRDGDRLTVTARVVGNFPGGSARLDHVFGLVGDRIESLEIG